MLWRESVFQRSVFLTDFELNHTTLNYHKRVYTILSDELKKEKILFILSFSKQAKKLKFVYKIEKKKIF